MKIKVTLHNHQKNVALLPKTIYNKKIFWIKLRSVNDIYRTSMIKFTVFFIFLHTSFFGECLTHYWGHVYPFYNTYNHRRWGYRPVYQLVQKEENKDQTTNTGMTETKRWFILFCTLLVSIFRTTNDVYRMHNCWKCRVIQRNN